jgi:alginate O-acetyltransferase complex protein AlgJ
MKTKARLFIFFALLITSIIPVINFYTNTIFKKNWQEWFSKAELYQSDFMLTDLSKRIYPLGISVAPNFAIVGEDDWIYLGDAHEQSVTRQRSGFADSNLTLAKTINSVASERDQSLKNQGVSEFIILVAPDKSTVYNDYLPNWAKPVTHTFTDTVMQQTKVYGKSTYLDTRSDFKQARSKYSEPLYFKTDTHWNSLGGWVAYRSLAHRLSQSDTTLNWFVDKDIVKSTMSREAGDLANFLRMEKILKDSQIDIKINNISPQIGEQYLNEISNPTEYKNPNVLVSKKLEPLTLITSKNALNKKKVLWLHDSFGFAMESFIYGSFAEVLQGSYASMDDARLEKIVSKFKPDYVLITVVERRIATPFFRQ